MDDKERNLPLIERDPLHEDHVMFIGADGGPVTEGEMFRRFGCDIPNENPDTPDRVEPDVTVEREFFEDDILVAPDGERVSIFSFEEPGGQPSFPAPTMRFVEGQIVHSIFHARKKTHTIHHHGIESTNFNDGVGHTSFEVNGRYAYQFLVSEAGTYLYHCHKNTTLHFEMGMYGFLIVDPPAPGAPFADGGPGFVRRGREIIPYDVEGLWAVDEIDRRWHRLINHHAGLHCPFYHLDGQGRPTGTDNPGLHDFNPDLFLISGVPYAGEPIADPRVALYGRAGDTFLLRVLNAGYTVQEFIVPDLDLEVIEIDGRPLGHPPFSVFTRPFTIAAGRSFRLTTAQRWGILARPGAPGTYPIRVRFHHWITDAVLAEIETFIRVEPD